MSRASKLVVDSGAIIKGTRLDVLADELFTTPEVLAEIKDRVSREQMHTLPYELKVRVPSAESLKFGIEFGEHHIIHLHLFSHGICD